MFRRLTLILLAALLVGCGGTTTSEPASSASAVASAVASAAASSAATTGPSAEPSAEPSASPASQETATAPAESAAAAPAESDAPDAAGGRTFQIVPEQSEASYSVQEQFLEQNLPVVAVGKTNAIEGEFQFTEDGQPNGKVTMIRVDLSTLTSDEPRRDNAIRDRWLESKTYPFAEFTSTEAQNLPTSYTEGEEISFKLVGDMKIRDVTKPVTFDVTGKLEGDTVTGTATSLIYMKDFGFDPPNIARVLTVEDGVTITLNFTAKEAAGAQ